MSKDIRILAIDPGYDRCGIAVIAVSTKPVLLHSICITTNPKDSHETRLAHIYSTLAQLIETWKPSALALETLFFSVNKKTALKVAEARGVCALLAGVHNLKLLELSPQQVKLGLTGSGSADKQQVQKMVSLIIGTDTSKKLDDEIDAIALGYAASGYLKFPELT